MALIYQQKTIFLLVVLSLKDNSQFFVVKEDLVDCESRRPTTRFNKYNYAIPPIAQLIKEREGKTPTLPLPPPSGHHQHFHNSQWSLEKNHENGFLPHHLTSHAFLLTLGRTPHTSRNTMRCMHYPLFISFILNECSDGIIVPDINRIRTRELRFRSFTLPFCIHPLLYNQ